MKSKQEFFKNRIEHYEEGDFVGQSDYIDVEIVEEIMDEYLREHIQSLPTDLDIQKQSENPLRKRKHTVVDSSHESGYEEFSFVDGAKWMRDQIISKGAGSENSNSSPSDTPILKEKI